MHLLNSVFTRRSAMVEKNKKLITTFLWGVCMVIAILFVLYMKSIENDKHNVNVFSVEQENEQENGMMYDGSENNPYLEGVQ